MLTFAVRGIVPPVGTVVQNGTTTDASLNGSSAKVKTIVMTVAMNYPNNVLGVTKRPNSSARTNTASRIPATMDLRFTK